MLKEIGLILQSEIHKQELRSPQCLGYYEKHCIIKVALSLKHFKCICFALSITIMLHYLKVHFKKRTL